MKKRHTTLTLMLLSAILLTSCGDVPTAQDTDKNDDTIISDTTTAPDDGLPDKKWNGETVNMLVRTEFRYEFDAESNGDIVDDAIYNRNRDIEERFNINLEILDVTGTFTTRATFLNALTSSVLADDGAYDLVASAANYLLPVIPDRIFYDLYNAPYVDLSREWWSQGYVENMVIDNSLYLATGSASLNSLENMCVMFFNKQMVTDFNLENPYELVDQGKWTFDKLMEMSHLVTSDLNGDNVIDADDRVGFYTCGNMRIAQTISFGLDFSKRNSEGYPDITYLSERMMSAFDKFSNFINSGDLLDGKLSAGDTLDLISLMQQNYQNGNMLFMAQLLSAAKAMRGMDVDFGIIPMPKLDEAQERYYTCAQENLTVLGIPASVIDAELASAVLEAMAVDGYKNVTPAYFENALKGKYTRDNESAEMLELIRDSLWFDFAYLNSVSLDNINHLFNNAISSGNGLASAFESRRSIMESELEKLIEGYASLKS